jgi:hypothetical protein
VCRGTLVLNLLPGLFVMQIETGAQPLNSKKRKHLPLLYLAFFYVYISMYHQGTLMRGTRQTCVAMSHVGSNDCRETTGLSAENTELKIRLQAMEQHGQLRDGEAFCGYNSFVNQPLLMQFSWNMNLMHPTPTNFLLSAKRGFLVPPKN